MAIREIVIRIPEDKYDRLMQQMKLDRNFNECEITELGKHGDLKDADVLDRDLETRYRKEWFEEVLSEIKELARLHSTEVPMVYGDGTETTDKMVSLEELGRILAEIEDGIGENL